MSAPFFYEQSNRLISQDQPGLMHMRDNSLFVYFQRYLIQKAISIYDWELPDTWDNNYFLYTLFLLGHIAIINTDKFGVIPQQCGLYGYNVMYQPTRAIISNPLLSGNLQPKINIDCTVLRLAPDWGGIYDLISYYANLFACAAESSIVNLLNSKFSYVFFAKDKAQAESYKKFFDSFTAGHPATVIDKNLMGEDGKPNWLMFGQNVGQNYIVDKNLLSMRLIEEMFDSDIGIPNINKDKSERMIGDEVNSNNIETYAKAVLWLGELQKGCEKARRMFGINISVKLRDFSEVLQKATPEIEGGKNNAGFNN